MRTIGSQTVQTHRTQIDGVAYNLQVSTYAGAERGWIISHCNADTLSATKYKDTMKLTKLSQQ